MNSPMNTPELIQWLRDNSSGVYRPANEAADLLTQMATREATLIAALRGARDYLDRLLSSSPIETEHLSREMPQIVTALNAVLHLDAFDLGDDVIAFGNGLHAYQGVISGKRTQTDGSPLYTVEDQNGDHHDHELAEVRQAD